MCVLLARWYVGWLRLVSAQPSPTLGMQHVLASPPRNLPPMATPESSPGAPAAAGMRESAMATASVLIDGVQLGVVRCTNHPIPESDTQSPPDKGSEC